MAYTKSIENFLKKGNKPYSASYIAEHVFGIKVRKDNLPSSKEELKKLTHIKDALKILVKEKKVIESLFEDPFTKEQKMHYSLSGWNATP